MFENIGRNAVDGALKRIQEKISLLNPNAVAFELKKLAEKIPIIGELQAGYNTMTPEEKATFMKNIMLAAAAMAAKNGGKVNF